jgi:hypothetical protein
MNVPAALAIQSLPFAWLVLSMIVWLGDQAAFDQAISAAGELD